MVLTSQVLGLFICSEEGPALYFLRQLKEYNLPQEPLAIFYMAIIHSVLCSSNTVDCLSHKTGQVQTATTHQGGWRGGLLFSFLGGVSDWLGKGRPFLGGSENPKTPRCPLHRAPLCSSDWLKGYQLKVQRHRTQLEALLLLFICLFLASWRAEDVRSFPGNSNADSVVKYKLQQSAVARFLRLIPLDWNPTGRIGLRLEAYGCPYTSDVVSFDGSSSLTYRPGPSPRRGSKQVVSLNFKTLRNSGTLLHVEGQDGLGISLELERGKLQLLLREGTSSSSEPRQLTSLGSLLDDQHWHHVVLRQKNSQLNLTVDKHTETVWIPEEFNLWDVKLLTVGAAQNAAGPRKNVQGCLENLMYNSVNLTELAKSNDQQVNIKNESANTGTRGWVRQEMEEAMKCLPTDLEVVPSPLLLEEMELAPAGPGSGRGAVDLFTFLSREAERTLRRSAGLSVPQSAYDGSGLAIPCPGTGPLRRRSLPAPLAAHSGPAVKPSPSSRRKKRRRGAPSCSAGEEVVCLPADVRAAASKPASLPATALSPRLAASPLMPSSLPPARCSEATPDELEERLRFFARQIKTFRRTSLMYSSPELMERIRQMEGDYETAVRQFYCRPPSPTPSHQRAAAAQPTSDLQRAAAAQPTSDLQRAAAAQPTSDLQRAAAAQPTSDLQRAAAAQPTSDLQRAAAAQPTSDLQRAAAAQPMSCLQSAAAAEQSTQGLQGAAAAAAAAEQSSPRKDSRELLLLLLQSSPRQVSRARSSFRRAGYLHFQPVSARPDTPHPDTPQPVSARPDTPHPDTPQPVSARPDTTHPDTPQPVSARLDTPQPDTPQPVSARPDSPQPDSPQPNLKYASTSSTRRRGRRKRDASAPAHATEGLGDASAPAHATEGLGDASAPAHATEGLGDASAPAHATEGLGDASAPAHATEGLGDASAPAHATEGLGDASAPAHATEGLCDTSAPAHATEGLCGKLVLVLASEPCDEGYEEEAPPDPVSGDFKGQFVLVLGSEPLDEGFEEEAPPDPVSGDFKGQFVLVLASEPLDEGFEEEAPPDPVSGDFKEQFVLVLASEPRGEGSPGSASASEGSPGSASASEGSPGSASASEGSPGSASASEGSPGSASASEGSPGIHGRPPETLCPARDDLLVARLNSVPARDDLLVARLNSVPARDDLLVARLNSVPARDDLLVARLNSVPARDDLLVARLNSVPARDDLLVARLNSVPAREDLLVARLNSVPVLFLALLPWPPPPARFGRLADESAAPRSHGNVTFSCAEPISVAVTFPGPHSFLQLPWTASSSSGGMSIGFQFRTWNKAGLLLTFDLSRQGGEVWLYLNDGRLYLQIQKGGKVLLELSAGSALNDGQWHVVDLTSRRGHLTVSVNKQGGVAHASPSFPVAVSNHIFFGGCPAEDHNQDCRNPHNTFQGCMRLLALDYQPVDLIMVQQRLLGNYSQLQIDMCGIIDSNAFSRKYGYGILGVFRVQYNIWHRRVLPVTVNTEASAVRPGPSSTVAAPTAATVERLATAVSHMTPKHHHVTTVYEQSCEAYKHNGNTSGYFYIDVDGSGPIKPQLVYCNMTDENTWMVIQHNNTELTKVRPSPGENQHLVHFDYMSEEEQLKTIIHQSEHCQQELSYHCRKSRLLNTQGRKYLH
ncbi:hypothetical protein CRENBAI_010841 [Crenichthys baileyi]|uniref:Contactin-associated protein-like 4 n=1 Tax=Crenichthys baileyi TaxID=28760 RepID=A0AAV9RDN2_9TELE